MIDPSPLENEFRTFVPVPAPQLRDRIAAALDHPARLSLPDRCLLAAITAGIAAALTIVTLLTLDLAAPAPRSTYARLPAPLPRVDLDPDKFLAHLEHVNGDRP